MFSTLHTGNVEMFAIKHYSNSNPYGEEEFEEDYRRFKLMNRLLNRNSINHRLILNTIITLQNTFGVDGTKVLLFYNTDKNNWGLLKSFLIYLGYIDPLEMIDIIPDYDISQELEKI
jgi:hypothetical protein